MMILINGLKLFVCTAVAGKFVCIRQVFAKYNRIVQRAFKSYSEAFSIAAKRSLLHV